MDPNNGKILDHIGPDRGVETPDDVRSGPTARFTGLQLSQVK